MLSVTRSRLYRAHRSVRALSTDVIVVGGGLVGCATAAAMALAAPALQITLLDGAPPTAPVAGFGNRVSAVNNNNLAWLDEGCFVDLSGVLQHPFSGMKVWGGQGGSPVVFNQSECTWSSSESMGSIVDNTSLIHALEQSLAASENVTTLHRTSVTSVSLPSASASTTANSTTAIPWAQVALSDGTELTARLVVAADGARSPIRTQANIPIVEWDYKELATVATLQLSPSSSSTTTSIARQRFLPTGPIALLPIGDDRLSLVWSHKKGRAEEMRSALTDSEFVETINTLFEGEVAIESVVQGSRASFPLSFSHATHYVSPRLALVGDAAHRIHPLAGQGVNLGFRDAFALTECVTQSLQTGRDIGCLHGLLSYETARQRANVPLMTAVDLCARLMPSQWTPVSALTQSALSLAANSSFVRSALMRAVTLV